MADEKIIRAIVEKCDVLYDDLLLSKETVIRKYLSFFAKQFDPSERSVSFAFHTGSLCFDIVSVAALLIGCLAYEFSSNDDILSELKPGDMVLFNGERYRWGGIVTERPSRKEPLCKYILLTQDGKGKNGGSVYREPYDKNKHLIKPYYGMSAVTDGRGIRRDTTNRNNFISCVLEIPEADVPITLDLSVVVVADKNEFVEISKHLRIRYDAGKTVSLTDIVPISYYTGNGEIVQIGSNPSKAEAVIKVTSKMSMARELVLDKNGNRTIGLMVTNADGVSANTAELNDLLRRRTLKFAYVVAPFNADSCEMAMELYESAKMFACTKELLSGAQHKIIASNKLTKELNRQISNIIGHKVGTVFVNGCWSWEQYRSIKEKLWAIKNSNWSGEDRDNFILSTMAVINLFSTAFFTMKRMESAISAGEINPAVVSPEVRISELMNIASRAIFMKKQCVEITSTLLEMYTMLYDASPKETALIDFLGKHSDERIAFVVPKAYYGELFARYLHDTFPNVICITANRFDNHEEFDRVITTGDVVGTRFDSLHNFSSPELTLLLYPFEEKVFSGRRRKARKSERKLNARIKGLKGDDLKAVVETADEDAPEVTEQILHEFSDLDAFVEAMGRFDIRRLTARSGSVGDYSNTAEVKFAGIFTTGEQILFSKYYSAVVFDQNAGSITEKNPDKLLPGDILVFTKKNDYTRNIVDQIFDQLMRTKKLSEAVQDAAEKAFYWKEALREYKETNKLSYRAVTKNLRKMGSSLNEVTIRQWLYEESHIIGPRDPETMKLVGALTADPYIVADPNGYYEACRVVRRYRREILTLIAQAINDKLSNKQPVEGSAFEVVYENVEKLSETLELESVFELDDIALVNSGIVNRPISESEVLM